jgi:hypothetical protein
MDYPFTVIQMEIGRDGPGKGTLSYATKIVARGNIVEPDNFATRSRTASARLVFRHVRAATSS